MELIKDGIDQIEQMECMVNTWGVESIGREDMMKRTLSKALNTKRESSVEQVRH